jgi:hypothetical protein
MDVYLNRCLLVLIVFPFMAGGQITGRDIKGKDVHEVKAIFDELKTTKELFYAYTMNIQYPNKHTSHLKGEVYINDEAKLLYNDCEAFTMIYSGNWFYKADHKKKTVTIVNLEKSTNKAQRTQKEDQIFKNGGVINFIDSVLFKYASVTSYSRVYDTIKIELGCRQGPVKQITLDYDDRNKLIIDYRIVVFQPMEKKNEEVVGITQEMRCENFKRGNDKKKYEKDIFFEVSKERIILKKFSDYKLFSKP